MFIITIALFSLSASVLTAQSVKRAYKLLEKADYLKAFEVFQEALSENKEDPAVHFGMALILADEKSPQYNLIEAWEHANGLVDKLEQLSPEALEFIGEYFYNTESRHISRPVKKKMEYGIETIEAKLIKHVREENNLELVYTALEKFPDFRHYNNMVHIRNQLEFRKYEKMNTLEGYLTFIQKFPEAAQIDKAIRYRNKLAFEKALAMNTLEAYEDFIELYPDATERNMAVKKLHAVAFEQAKNQNTIKAFDDFIARFPDALEIAEARITQKQLLYEYAKKINTLAAYNDFIRKYPEGQQYIDIFNLKSQDNGARFLAAHPIPAKSIGWARSFEDENIEELDICFTSDTLNACIAAGTVFRSDTGYTDAWVIKMNPEGKMIWNKFVGEAFNDQIRHLAVNKRNEILGAGYTYTGTDSLSRESWLFKLGSDGQKIWSRKLGRMHINTLTIASNGSTVLGGYLVNDSLQNKYSVVVLNDNGKRLWGRTYSGTGQIVSINRCAGNRMLLTGNHWCAKIDHRGYLIWESSLAPSDSIVASSVTPKGENLFLVVRNNSKVLLIKTNWENKPVFEKELAVGGVPVKIESLVSNANNVLAALITFADHQSVQWINTSNGTITSSARLPESMRFSGLYTDNQQNLVLVTCHNQLIVIRNNGFNF